MKKAPSTASYHFLFASILSLGAQTFLLGADRQAYLLRGISSLGIITFSVFFFLASTLCFSLVFFTVSSRREKQITLFVLVAFSFYALLYARAFLFVETILFILLGIGYILEVWQKNKKDNLGYAMVIANIAVGASFLFDPDFLKSSLYLPAFPAQATLGFIFIGTAIIGIPSLLLSKKEIFHKFSKLIILPWLGWAFIFARVPEIGIFLPYIVISSMLLTSGLIPFEKIRLPESRMFGNLVFPASVLLQGLLLALFYYLLQGNTPHAAEKNDVVLLFSFTLSLFLLYSVMKSHSVINKLISNDHINQKEGAKKTLFEKFSNRLFAPAKELLPLSEWQAKKIQLLSAELTKEREGAKRFAMLNNLRKQLDDQLDDPVAAQLVVNATQLHFGASIVAILSYDIETHELCSLASAGKRSSSIPSGYRQDIDSGIMGRSARLRKTQVVNDTALDDDYFDLEEAKSLSEIAIPLIHHGHLKGVLVIDAEEKKAFSAADIRTLERIGEELINTWERSGHNRRLTTLIESSISLSTSLNPQAAVKEITLIARETLQARFVFVALFDQDGSFTRSSFEGDAPNLQAFLSRDLATNPLLRKALDATEPLRVRDIRRHKYAPTIKLDDNILRGVIIIPIRLYGVSIGAILGFGKQGGVFFTRKDEALAKLLAAQAAAAIESAWLIQELRSTAVRTTLLYQLSFGIIETESIEEAAQLIAGTAHRLAKTSVAGIVLFSLDKKIQTALEVTAEGVNFDNTVPIEFIRQTLDAGETITASSGEASTHIYLPIQTHLRKYGVLWMEFTESERQASSQGQTLKTLANQAAIALERVIFLLESRKKTHELKGTFAKLENSYDQTLGALMSALDARDRETEGHSMRVGKAAYLLGKEFNLSDAQRNSLQRGSLLHDIGKIGVSDAILNKAGKLTDEEWVIMRQHPSIGKAIIEDIPFLQDALPIVYSHHERWNGSGYPLGLRGTEIPLEARIFAVADIFDALTSNRPYRVEISDEEALAYLQEQAGILVDPDVVVAFERLLNAQKIRGATIPIR